MRLFKRNPFGHILFIKVWLIRILGVLSHSRFRGFNELQIEGSDVLRNLPDKNVLFISNHQTYFADVVAMFHVFNASLSGRENTIKNVGYIWKPKLNNSGNKMALHKPVAVNASNPHIEYENTENPTNIILILHIIKTSFFSLLGEIKKPPINLPTIIKSQ